MKVVLVAFGGKLKSEPMDWPENVGPDIFMALDLKQPSIKESPDAERFHRTRQTIGRFQREMNSQILSDGTVAAVYKLVDI